MIVYIFKKVVVFFFFLVFLWFQRASQMALVVKNLPAMQETCVRSLGQENPLEEEMATLSSSLAWKILRGAWWSTVHGDTRVRHDLVPRPQQASC